MTSDWIKLNCFWTLGTSLSILPDCIFFYCGVNRQIGINICVYVGMGEDKGEKVFEIEVVSKCRSRFDKQIAGFC